MKDKYIKTILDSDGKPIVVIDNIMFSGKRKIDWDEVEEYLNRYINELYTIMEYGTSVYIGKDFPDEFTGSKYTRTLRGAFAKAKANSSQAIPEMIEFASKERYKVNLEEKHSMNAKFGWYRYDSRFALPVYDDKGNVERYNVFLAELLIRHDANGKRYLYDIINIKKETSNPPSLMHTV